MTAKQQYIRLTALCTAVYLISYVSRINLAAVMVELIHSGFAEKTDVALALTVCSVTYGGGQVLSGWLGDRCRPQNVILTGFLLTAAMNLGVCILQTPAFLTPLWAVNGLAQAFMWPPLLRILTSHLTQEDYSRACVWVSWGSSFGTMAVYALSPLLIRMGSFRTVFLCSGMAALTMALVWKTRYEKLFGDRAPQKAVPVQAEAPGAEPMTGRVFLLMGAIMVGIMLHGALRDGVTNWMPTFVSESFGLDSSSAIYTGVLLPVFAMLSIKVASWLYQRLLPNEATASGVFFAAGCGASLLLTVLMEGSMVTSALLMAFVVGCMHGVNYTLVTMTPTYFRRYGHVALVSGVLNGATYVGSAVSTYGIALLSEHWGWHGTGLLWAVMAGAGAVLCFLMAGAWKKFKG